MIKNEDGKISFHFLDLVEYMPIEVKRELAEKLVWDKEIFDELVEALMGERVVTKNFNSFICNARDKMHGMLPEVARNIVRTLIYENDQLRADKERLDKWAWSLYHRWPDAHFDSKPVLPDYIGATWPTDDEVEKKLSGDS